MYGNKQFTDKTTHRQQVKHSVKSMSHIIWHIIPQIQFVDICWCHRMSLIVFSHCDLDLSWKKWTQSRSPILFMVAVPYLVCRYILGHGDSPTLSRSLWPGPQVSVLARSSPEHICTYYPTVYIQSNCLFFAMSWVTKLLTRQYFRLLTALYHGLVSRFPVKNTQALISMRVDDARTVRLWKEMVKMRHGLATLNSNNSIGYGQKHKVLVLVFLVRTRGTLWDLNGADLVKFSVLQQNCIVYSNSIQGTLLSITSNGLGNKTVISCLFEV